MVLTPLDAIYARLIIIPSPPPRPISSSLSGPKITYHVYKASSQYKKSAPGPPDFYVAVLDARASRLPTESELETLWSQTPFHHQQRTTVDGKYVNVNQRIKKGARSVVLAIVDQGITSFLTISEPIFGQNKLWDMESAPRGKKGTVKGKPRPSGGQ